jgi:hypothetical protein
MPCGEHYLRAQKTRPRLKGRAVYFPLKFFHHFAEELQRGFNIRSSSATVIRINDVLACFIFGDFDFHIFVCCLLFVPCGNVLM